MTMMNAKGFRALVLKHERLDEALALLALAEGRLWYVTGPDGEESLEVATTVSLALERAEQDPYTGAYAEVEAKRGSYTATRVRGIVAGD